MTNARSEDYSVQEAVRDIEALTGFERGLRQRTEGITCAVWGLVTAGIFLSYGYAGSHFDGPWPWWATQLWLPWVAAGSALSAALWRSASLTAPRAADNGVPGWVHMVTWPVLIFLIVLVAFYARTGIKEPVFPLLGIGVAALFFGVTNVFRYTPTGRAVMVVEALVLLTAGAVEILLDVGYDTATIVGALVGGGSFFLGGLYETLRG